MRIPDIESSLWASELNNAPDADSDLGTDWDLEPQHMCGLQIAIGRRGSTVVWGELGGAFYGEFGWGLFLDDLYGPVVACPFCGEKLE